jgi:hypothetical protein
MSTRAIGLTVKRLGDAVVPSRRRRCPNRGRTELFTGSANYHADFNMGICMRSALLWLIGIPIPIIIILWLVTGHA